jgi:lauroyl/myristoyl acyltransferase
MLARASFDQAAGAKFAMTHGRLLAAAGRLPHGPLHKALVSLIWLETWLRWPLKTLRMLDSVDETFSLLDPDGRRFGLKAKVRAEFHRNILYFQIADLAVLLTSLDKSGFRRRALVVENEEALLRERERGPGAIVAAFRIGAYPVVPWALASLGFPVSMIVATTPFVEMGQRMGEKFIPGLNERLRFMSAEDPRVLARSLESLNAGGFVCTLTELPPVGFAKTTQVQFLGWTIEVPYGIAYLAAATGRSIVPAALTREAGPRFRMRFGEPLPPPSRDRVSILRSTQRLYEVLEEKVRQFPEQWVGWTMLASHMGIDLSPAASQATPTIS